MAIEFAVLPGWRFEAKEVSASDYKVTGIDGQGRTVEATGTVPNAFLDQCRHNVLEMLEKEGALRDPR